ncbi:MAG: hypothetical protein WDW36_003697 [Sanguina aurantia]
MSLSPGIDSSLPLITAGLVMGVVTIIGLGGPILGGILADRWQKKNPGGRMRLASASIAVATVFLFLVLLAALDIHNRTLMLFCALMMPFHSVFVGMAFPAVAATSQAVVPAHLKGLSWGTGMLALYLLGGAWGPLLVGAVSDAFSGGYQGLALGIALTGVFGFIASWMWFMSARHVASDTQHNAGAADAFWDQRNPLTGPLRAILQSTCLLFPALVSPLLQLISAVCVTPGNARIANEYLSSTWLVSLHAVDDPAVHYLDDDDEAQLQPTDGGGGGGGGGAGAAAAVHRQRGAKVVLRETVQWNQAPTVPSLQLPQGCGGQLQQLPAIMSQLAGKVVLVAWDVDVGDEAKSFGLVLLLGRAAHLLMSLDGGGQAPPAQTEMLEELGESLSLLVKLCKLRPEIVPNLAELAVFLQAGQKTTWADVAAGAIAVLCRRVPSPQVASTAAHALELLGSISGAHPSMVLSLLLNVQLLQSPMPAHPATFHPLSQLSSQPMLQGLSDLPLSGLLPHLITFQRLFEAPFRTYPVTRAFLSLLASYLERGYCDGPLPGHCLYVLQELLPTLHQWGFREAGERWQISAAAIKVLRLAVAAGAFVVEGCNTGSARAAGSTAEGIPALVHISGLSAHLLRLLLLQGQRQRRGFPRPHTIDVLWMVSRSQPELELVKSQEGAASSVAEVAALESLALELLMLLPSLLRAAAMFEWRVPFLTFLFGGWRPAAQLQARLGASEGCHSLAALLAGYTSYRQPELEFASSGSAGSGQDGSLATHALIATAAMLEAVAGCSSGSGGGDGMSCVVVVPEGGAVEDCLREMFRPDYACAHPSHFSIAVDILSLAVRHHPQLLDALLLPSGLDPAPSAAAPGSSAQPPLLLLGAPANAASVTPGASGSGAVTVRGSSSGGESWSALDGLYELLAVGRDQHPEVLCNTLRALMSLWSSPHLAHRPTALLRAAPEFWSRLESCLPGHLMAHRASNARRDRPEALCGAADRRDNARSDRPDALRDTGASLCVCLRVADALCGALLVALQCARGRPPPPTSTPPAASNGHPRAGSSTAPSLATALLQLLPHLITLTTTQSLLQTAAPSPTHGGASRHGGGAASRDAVALTGAAARTAADGSSAGAGSAAAAGASPPPLASLAVVCQLLVEVVGRWLSPAEWVPMMRGAMRGALLPGLDSGGGGSQGSSAAGQPAQVGGMGILQLALAVAQTQAGALLMYEEGVLERCIGCSRALLEGPALGLGLRGTDGSLADVGGAYVECGAPPLPAWRSPPWHTSSGWACWRCRGRCCARCRRG